MRQMGMRGVQVVGIGFFFSLIITAMLFIGLPIIALVWRNLHDQAWQLALDKRVPQSVIFSLKTTLISLLLILLFGTPLAYALAYWRFPGKRLVNVLVDLPIVLPPAVAGLGLLVAFGRRGLLGPSLDEWFSLRLVFTQAAVVIAQTFVALPFYIRAAQAGFREVDPELENAAQVDGANVVERFIYITFPIVRRSLLSGALVSWARALGEFGATIFFAGNLLGRPQTMPLLIYNIFESDVQAAIWVALILIGMAAFIIGITRWLSQDDQITWRSH
ncbi:MAG: ABC transporter permease [Anaerolineae bacterium]|nr:ABC transporter permease [Anaerolineae bacterium]